MFGGWTPAAFHKRVLPWWSWTWGVCGEVVAEKVKDWPHPGGGHHGVYVIEEGRTNAVGCALGIGQSVAPGCTRLALKGRPVRRLYDMGVAGVVVPNMRGMGSCRKAAQKEGTGLPRGLVLML